MKIAVVGCGYMGCGVIGLLKLRGAQVTAVDIRPESLINAKQYGADEVYIARMRCILYTLFIIDMTWEDGEPYIV